VFLSRTQREAIAINQEPPAGASFGEPLLYDFNAPLLEKFDESDNENRSPSFLNLASLPSALRSFYSRNFSGIDPSSNRIDIAKDQNISFRNALMSLNVLISIILMIWLLQMEWNGEELIATNESYVVKLTISVLTVVMLLQILEYYFRMIQYMKEESERRRHDYWKYFISRSAYRKQSDKEVLAMTGTATLLKKLSSSKTLPPLSFHAILESSAIGKMFFLEIFICSIHPFPLHTTSTTKLGLWMFLRLYVLFKVMRDFSPIFRNRRTLMRIRAIASSNPIFNSFLSLKVLFFLHPITFIVLWIGFLCAVLGYCIYIFEREAQPEEFSYRISVYLAFISMVTGWATDTYDEYNPETWGAKFFAISCVIFGLFLFALLIDYVHASMSLSEWQQIALHSIRRTFILEKLRTQAALLIQTAWRYRLLLRKKRKRRQLPLEVKEEDGESSEMTQNLEVLFFKRLKSFQKIRSEKLRHDSHVPTGSEFYLEGLLSEQQKKLRRQEQKEHRLKTYIDQSIAEMQRTMNEGFSQILEQQRSLIEKLRSTMPEDGKT